MANKAVYFYEKNLKGYSDENLVSLIHQDVFRLNCVMSELMMRGHTVNFGLLPTINNGKPTALLDVTITMETSDNGKV